MTTTCVTFCTFRSIQASQSTHSVFCCLVSPTQFRGTPLTVHLLDGVCRGGDQPESSPVAGREVGLSHPRQLRLAPMGHASSPLAGERRQHHLQHCCNPAGRFWRRRWERYHPMGSIKHQTIFFERILFCTKCLIRCSVDHRWGFIQNGHATFQGAGATLCTFSKFIEITL